MVVPLKAISMPAMMVMVAKQEVRRADVEMPCQWLARNSWGSDQTGDPVQTFLGVYLNEVAAELPPQHRIGGAAQLAIAGGNVLQLAFPDELDTDLRVASYMTRYLGR